MQNLLPFGCEIKKKDMDFQVKFQGDRVSPVLDNFTCINAHGKSIVDYMLIHQESLNLVSKCEVMLVNELLHNYKLSN